ncbi:IS3 family transposase [Mesorhizobium sp. Cs1299R1N1]|uniref:IS3 family transposase n=1 Tax=Mesorhizobium sp. Cs1299R1N1 TaxID=3015172 RepID=UPI003FA530B2
MGRCVPGARRCRAVAQAQPLRRRIQAVGSAADLGRQAFVPTDRGFVQHSQRGLPGGLGPIESFFATLKSELFHPERFETVQSLDTAIEHYIDYYNHRRIKLKLKGLAPVQYRTQPLNLPDQ